MAFPFFRVVMLFVCKKTATVLGGGGTGLCTQVLLWGGGCFGVSCWERRGKNYFGDFGDYGREDTSVRTVLVIGLGSCLRLDFIEP